MKQIAFLGNRQIEAIRADPDDPEPYRGLAAALMVEGREAAAGGQLPHDESSMEGKNVRSTIIQKLYRGQDPFVDFPADRYSVDIQGWGSEHPYLVEAMDAIRPRVVVEIGVWKGGSTLTMARRLKELRLDAVVIAVDTWLGSWDHWETNEWFGHLRFDNGYPTLAHVFMANVVKSGLQDYIVPLPLDSLNAAHVIRSFDIIPDVVHIDGGHDYEAVSADLRVWWDLIKPGGILIGDDYSDISWPDVKRAFDDFFGPRGLTPFEFGHNKCRIRKPSAPVDFNPTRHLGNLLLSQKKLYLMTTHATYVGISDNGNLIQIDSLSSDMARAVCIADILKDFILEVHNDGISFKKGDKYLCALENSTSFAVDRDHRNTWEIFQPVDERGFVGLLADYLLSLPVENDHHANSDASALTVLRPLLERYQLSSITILSDDAKTAARSAALMVEAAGLDGPPIRTCAELPEAWAKQGDSASCRKASQSERPEMDSARELVVVANAAAFPKVIRNLSRRKAPEASISPEVVILTNEIGFWYSAFSAEPDGFNRALHPMTAVVWPNLMYLSNRDSCRVRAPYGGMVASVRKDGVTFLTEGYSLANARTSPTLRIFRPILEECARFIDSEPRALVIQYDDATSRDIVSVAYGRSRGLRNVRLVPDPYFLESHGFAALRTAASEDRLPPWHLRKEMVFWRGTSSTNFQSMNGEPVRHITQVPRVAMCLLLKSQLQVDAALMNTGECDNNLPTPPGSESLATWLDKQGIFRPGEPMIRHAEYRYLIDIDGVANAWSFFEKLLLGSCVLKVDSSFEQWFYDEVNPWEHFVPVKHNFYDLIEKIEWCREHENEAREIAERGQRFALEYTYEAGLAAMKDAIEYSLVSDGSDAPPDAVSVEGEEN